MRTLYMLSVICLVTVSAGGAGTDSGSPSKPPMNKAEKNRAAIEVVKGVLRREIDESIADRSELLKPALDLVPHHEAAHWLSGEIFEGRIKKWLRYTDVPDVVKDDDRIASYRVVRLKYGEKIGNQIELAQWCIKHNLMDQARAHLTKVLELNSDNQTARQLLGQRFVSGNWLSEEDLARYEDQSKKDTAAFGKWRNRIEKIGKNLQSGKRQSEAAREELYAIKDPEAAWAIEVVLCSDNGRNALSGIEALKHLKGRESAVALARLAFFMPWEPTGHAAAKGLAYQSKHDYVPQLLAMMKAEVQSQSQIYQSYKDGALLYRQTYYREGADQQEMVVFDTPYQHVFTNSSNNTTNQMTGRAGRYANSQQTKNLVDDMIKRKTAMEQFQMDAMQKAAARQAEVAKYNMTVDMLNTKLCDILKAAVYESPGNDELSSDYYGNNSYANPRTPREWSQWWNDYNEVYVPEKQKKFFYASNPQTQLISTIASVPEKQKKSSYINANTNTRNPQTQLTSTTPSTRYECLTGDTKVWTESGPVAIMDINTGDRVFACDVETGCLALKPVLRKTIRPRENTGTLVSITANGTVVRASGGHVFWVAGQGWIKARDLSVGMKLHTIQGSVEIEKIAAEDPQQTYNLIVGDFHSFFAGDVKSLTHDNTVRAPTNMIVPSLSKLEANAPPVK